MKCIRTRYFGPTNTKGSRIIADINDGGRAKRVEVSRRYDLDIDADHARAAVELCGLMGWSGPMVAGWHNNAAYHVFTS